MTKKVFIWALGCTHGGKDIQYGRESLKLACQDIDGFRPLNLIAHLGDFSGQAGLSTDGEGALYRQQLEAGLTSYPKEFVYPLAGNHDRTDEPGTQALSWFNKWMDPLGQNPETSGVDLSKRPYPITEDSTPDAYEVRIGSLSLLFMSDVNRPLTPRRGELGGDPGGVVTPEAYQWWKDKCAATVGTDRQVITFAHYLPKDTTTATGEYEGGVIKQDGTYEGRYHGPGYTDGLASSYLGFVGEVLGNPFAEYMEENPGQCSMWIGAHNHVKPGKKVGGKAHIVKKYGCWFVQNGAVTMHHHGRAQEAYPKSRLYKFVDGSDQVKVFSYMHEAAGTYPKGLWSTRKYRLSKPVTL